MQIKGCPSYKPWCLVQPGPYVSVVRLHVAVPAGSGSDAESGSAVRCSFQKDACFCVRSRAELQPGKSGLEML